MAHPFPVPAAALVVAQLCRALDYIHHAERQIVHRDVTPHNVFVTRHGSVKLGDFGIAKAAARRSRTEAGQIKGKLAYLAPEQVRGDPVGVQTDVYAAGLILYELLTGQRLIEASRDVELLKIAQSPPDCSVVRARPEAALLEPALRRALRLNMKLRYPSAAMFAAELERQLQQTPFSADDLARYANHLAAGISDAPPASRPDAVGRPAAAASPLSVAASTHETTELGKTTRQAWKQGPWRAALIASGAAIVVMGIVAALFWTDPPPRVRSLLASADGGIDPPRAKVPAEAVEADVAVAVVDRDASVAAAQISRDAAPGSVEGTPSVREVALRASPRRPRRRVTPRRRVAPRRRDRRATSARRRRAEKPPAVAPEPENPEPPPEPRPPPVSAAAVAKRLDSVLKLARSRGLWPGDGPLVHGELARIRKDLRAGHAERAAAAVDRLDRAVQQARIDRQFVERKLGRLERAIQRRDPPAAKRRQLAALSQQILGLIMDRRFVEASRMISQAMGRL
jgi:hypothetical protein